ncbi:hypothetical protein BC629DRAFT_1590960 [Irpex lacteus]|nr:hypothetical protein BC629DRAFT_1590960 [Irpex lacteus]
MILTTTLRLPKTHAFAHSTLTEFTDGHTLPKVNYVNGQSDSLFSLFFFYRMFRMMTPAILQALEPHISGKTMALYYSKHHQTDINSLSAANDSYVKISTLKERFKLQAALRFA